MNDDQQKRMIDLLEKIADNQSQQIALTSKSLEMQETQFLRAERLAAKAEKLQDSSKRIVYLGVGAIIAVLFFYFMRH